MLKNTKIWIDADAYLNVIKEILFRAANHTKVVTIFVAKVNRHEMA